MRSDDERLATIRGRLVGRGTELMVRPFSPQSFAGLAEADCMLNDLATYPHAFVLACVMDRGMKAERVWRIPYLLGQKLGGFSMKLLAGVSREVLHDAMMRPTPLHRYGAVMAEIVHRAVRRIVDQYESDASRIWKDRPTSATVVYRFLEFDGVGPKIATMAANILARQYKVAFADHYSIDVSADVHVRRVFARLGLTPVDASVDQLVYRARDLHPEFPGILDSPVWEIGRTWCRPTSPRCSDCYLSDCCISAHRSPLP